ncbi:cellulase family glycosylhydrolase [Mycolicibacterium llatzerense]|uniref:cellulase family glycosylhydrolase n=1 Tax=Mycolicibacterium llatzerense TaxID=280871 RepID=UPI000B0D8FC4|nr:cellulase family glycosylhydrolase [Mycolicibacterium llatzerense]
MTTALMRAKIAVATSVLALSALSPIDQPHPPAPLSASPASPRTVSMAVQLAASVTEDGSSQTVGVADAYLYTLNQTDLVTQLSQIRSLGVTDLRIVVPWIYVQPTSAAAYDWTKMDNVVNTARAMGFSMTASITMNPPWNGTPLVGAPDPDTYATFAAAVAQRYGSSIAAYEIWNEPNAVTFLAPTDPRAYTAMLKAAYTAIKAVAPSATVIAGVLGAVTTVPGMSLAPQQFLAGMYAAGAQGFFDALSFHPYNYTLPFSAGAGVTNSPLEQVKALYALMTANGDSALKIWATEFGNPTSPGGINQTQQAQMLRDFVTAWSKLPFAGPAYVYTAADLNSGYLLDENNFGLFTTNGIPKLAAQTLATLISQLANGTLPNYTAPGMSAPQTIWIQLVSTAIAVVNQVLLIPNIATGILYNAAPRVLQQAFSAVAHAVSMSAAQTLNAITPAAETGIGLLVNFPTSVHAAAATIGANFYGTELTVARALASVGIGAMPNPVAAAATSTIAAVPSPAKAAVAAVVEPTSKPATDAGTIAKTTESTAAGTSEGPAPATATKVTSTSTDTAGATALPSTKTTTTASAATTAAAATVRTVDGAAPSPTATQAPAAKPVAAAPADTSSATARVPAKATPAASGTTSTHRTQQVTGAQESNKPEPVDTTKAGATKPEKTGGKQARHTAERTSTGHAAAAARS